MVTLLANIIEVIVNLILRVTAMLPMFLKLHQFLPHSHESRGYAIDLKVTFINGYTI